jgi:hypothetical protein
LGRNRREEDCKEKNRTEDRLGRERGERREENGRR